MIIEFPEEFAGGSLHSIWTELESLKDGTKGGAGDIFLDLANIRYIDAEGCNYLALIPALLTQNGETVQIVLPKKDNVIRFLEVTGLLEYYDQYYKVLGRSAEHKSRHRQIQRLARNQGRLVLNSKPVSTFVFDNIGPQNVFRLDILQMHMFARDSVAARHCCGAIYELISNVLDHSEETTGCVTIQFRRSGQLFIAVSDLGIGIKRSLEAEYLREYGEQTGRVEESAILTYAFKPGVTKTRLSLRGMGLPTVANLAKVTWLSSGNARVEARSGSGVTRVRETAFIPGTSAYLLFDIQGRGDRAPGKEDA